MFKHIFIPTDGSPLSTRAVEAGIAIAKESGARITACYVLDAVPARLFAAPYRGEEEAIARFEEMQRSAAREHVAGMARQAQSQGVDFDPVVETAATAYEGIVRAAEERKCDLILMSSHGRRGLARLALGSVTDKVIQLSKIPVLVYR